MTANPFSNADAQSAHDDEENSPPPVKIPRKKSITRVQQRFCQQPRMIHFFATFSNDAHQSPFAIALRAQQVAHRLFSAPMSLRYRSRLWLVVCGWPKVVGRALQSAVRSLLISKPYPDTVVVNSHLEARVFGLLRALLRRHSPRIVLLGFIYTQRRHALMNRLRQAYFRGVFDCVDQVICHSTLEARHYAEQFSPCRARFSFVPYGLHLTVDEGCAPPISQPYLLTAGRSGRDYATLFAAVAPLDVALYVVCDNAAMLEGLTVPPNVHLLRGCYDGDYVRWLRHARAVVIPLAVEDISAGQMVLIQAMACAKPTIVTRTVTTLEYASDDITSLLVPPRDPGALAIAIRRVMEDEALVSRLGQNSRAAYQEKFSMAAFVGHLVAAMGQDQGAAPLLV
ncbi:MAG: hypothetical protein RIR70_447 [Pseudomonadota bacterium]|jgi:glycosyltransferase involved in cell wall biosynthesis